MRLDGKVAVVTGGGRGIGKAIAVAFAAEGASVVVASRNMENLKKTVTEIESKGGKALAIQTDVTIEEQVERMVRQAVDAFGKIDILVNNSGIGGVTCPVVDLKLEDWLEVINVDLTGSMLCTKHALKYMIPQGSGVIINIAAEGGRAGDGRAGYPMRSPYCCAKMGLIGLTETVAVEVGKYGIRVNAISPAAVRGERLENVVKARAQAMGVPYEELMAKIAENYSLGRIVEEREVAAVAVFLASDEASAITGQTIPVHCGHHVNF